MPGIVVGIDGSVNARRALEWAMREAVLRQVPLTVIAVSPALVSVFGAVTLPEGGMDAGQARAHAQADVDKALATLAGPPPEVTVRVTPGSPPVELINAATGADLLVLGARGSGGFGRLLLGSVSGQVMHHAPCPVAIVPGPAR
jgi:nucleotide-binding universal stress UspA family protein